MRIFTFSLIFALSLYSCKIIGYETKLEREMDDAAILITLLCANESAKIPEEQTPEIKDMSCAQAVIMNSDWYIKES